MNKTLTLIAGIIIGLGIAVAVVFSLSDKPVLVEPGIGREDTVTVDPIETLLQGQTLEQYEDSCKYSAPGKDSSWTDDKGSKYRGRNGYIFASLPKGFHFWVIWDKKGYKLTKWGKEVDSL